MERCDFSSISTCLKNQISESNQMSQPEFLYEIFEDFDGYNNGNIRFAGDGRTTASNVELNKEKIQREGDSDGRRNIKNDNNDNLSEEKYSRDVDYAEYAQHIVRFLKQI